jgi:hypothetical protein
MANTYAQNIKAAIVNDMQGLVDSGALGSFLVDDMSKVSPFDRDWPAFPSAVVIAPTVGTSDYLDTQTNLREYTFWVAVVTKPENMPDDPTYLEGLIDAVLGAFDADVTLQGSSVGGVSPAVVESPGPVKEADATYVVFYVVLKCRTIVTAGVR